MIMPRLLGPRLRAQIRKEFLSVLRDPRARTILVAPPLMMLVVFVFAMTLEVRNVEIAVIDRDAGRWSHELVATIGSAQFVGQVHTVHSPAQLHTLIDRRQAIAAFDIPPDFSRKIAAGQPAVAQVLLDGRRANAAQITLGYLNAATSGIGDAPPAPAPAAIRHGFNPNLEYRWFVVPGLAGMLALLNAMMITSLSIARERELGTFDQLLVSPTTTAEIIIAKTVPALIIATLLGLLMIGAGVGLFRIPFTGSFWLLLPSLVLFILSMVGIGLMISSISSTQQQAILGMFAVLVPSVLMSGFATPVENMPLALQWIAQAIPLKHFLVIVQGSFLKSLPPAQIWANAWPLAAIALVTLSAATVFVRSKLQ